MGTTFFDLWVINHYMWTNYITVTTSCSGNLPGAGDQMQASRTDRVSRRVAACRGMSRHVAVRQQRPLACDYWPLGSSSDCPGTRLDSGRSWLISRSASMVARGSAPGAASRAMDHSVSPD